VCTNKDYLLTYLLTYFSEDDVGGQAKVTRDEERVLQCEDVDEVIKI